MCISTGLAQSLNTAASMLYGGMPGHFIRALTSLQLAAFPFLPALYTFLNHDKMAQPGLEHLSGPFGRHATDLEYPEVISPPEKDPPKYFSGAFITAQARTKKWVWLSVLIAIIVVAAVAGGVAGGLRHSRKTLKCHFSN